MSYKVGDWVKVLHTGGNFSGYEDFFEQNNLGQFKEKFRRGSSPVKNEIHKIVAIGRHENTPNSYGPLYVIESRTGQVYIINNKSKSLELTELVHEFRIGDKVVPVSKNAGKAWRDWIEQNNYVHQHFVRNGFLYVVNIGETDVTLAADKIGYSGDFFLKSDLVPYVEPVKEPKFQVGDKVVPISKSVWTDDCPSWQDGKCKTPYLFVNGIDQKESAKFGKLVYFCATERKNTGDYYTESDLIPYVEPKPYNNRTVTNEIFLLPEHSIIYSKTIFNGPATICILSYDNKQFKGVAKCNPADTYNENIGQLIATERASIELSKYRISQAIR